MISITSTVMIAIVIIRFVAILHEYQQQGPSYLNSQDKAKGAVPTSHPLQRFHAPIHIPLTLQHGRPCMLYGFPLYLQIRQSIPSNPLGLIRNPLRIPQPLTAPIQPVRATQQLLPLLQLLIARIRRIIIVPVAGAKEGGFVGGEGFELALARVDVGLMVPDAGVDGGAGVGGDVLLLEAHLGELLPLNCQRSS